jgi:hypothetical protein
VLDTPDAGWSPEDGDKDEIAEFVTDLLVKQKGEMLSVYFGLRFDVSEGTLETLPELLDHYVPPLNLLPMFLLRLAIQVDWTSEERCFETIAMEFAEFYMVREGCTTADALPKELREFAAGAAAESDRGRTSQTQLSQMLEASSDVKAASGGDDDERRSDGDSGEAGAATSTSGGGAGREAQAQGAPGRDSETAAQAHVKASHIIEGGGEWRWCVQHVLFPAMRYLVLPPRAFANDGTVVQLVCTSQLYKVFERC